MRRDEINKLLIAGGIFAVVLAILIWQCVISIGQAIELTILFVLVLVTAIYAKRTAEIADATKEQAKEVKEQKYSESLPLLIPHFPPDVDTVAPSGSLYQFLRYGGINVLWHNVGKGVAINSTFSLWGATLPSGEVHRFLALESLALGSRQQIATSFEVYSIQRDKPERYQPRLEAEYQDIYERKITTVQEFHIDGEAKTAFLGELYFTVNGKRLGEEITSHD